MENRINRPTSGDFDIDFLGGSSRKRKSTAMDQLGAISESTFQYHTSWESNRQKANFISGDNQPKSTELTSLNHQFQTQNCYPGSWLNHNGNFYGKTTKNISNASSSVPTHPLEYKVSNWQAQAHNVSGPSEACTFLPLLKSDDAPTGRAQIASRIEELQGFGIKNHLTDKMALGVCSAPSKSLSIEILQQRFLKPEGHPDNIDENREDNKSGVPYELRQNSDFSINRGISDNPSVGAASMGSSPCIERSCNHMFLQNEVRLGSSRTLDVSLAEISENGEQGQGDGSVKIKETTEATGRKKLMHPLPESSLSPTSTVESGQKKDQTRCSPRSDEKSKSHSGKPASIIAEKLWDGSVQLNSSVVVSAVAFFRSGEKLLDTNWCESVEVKGKVRLEAFEKYIQDLPRSRNKGLMVISLCWKKGSSETGLKGMKEVAKGYKKGEKVGFAQLSPGIDLYICPRSDAIITILAKYGFFKGMAAVEDNPDSMIGCVVWRKGRTSSNSAVKKSESKILSEKPPNSPSISPMKQTAEKDLSAVQPAQPLTAPASVIASSTTEGAGKDDSDSKNIDSSKNQIATDNSLVGPEQPKTSLELQEPVMPSPSNAQKDAITSSDDDDLPEFDFGTACGIFQTNMTKRLPAEGTRNADRSVLPGAPSALAMPISSQISDHLDLPRLLLTANEGIPPLNKICDREPQIPVFPNMSKRSTLQNKVATPVASTPRNLFDDDDDDMPEWCPPDLQRKSMLQTTRLSTTSPSQLPSSYLRTLTQGPPRPVPSSPSLAAPRPPFSSQPFPLAFHHPTTKSPQPRPPKRAPSASMGSNSGSILGPPPSFDAKLPFYPAEKRGWRPR